MTDDRFTLDETTLDGGLLGDEPLPPETDTTNEQGDEDDGMGSP